MFLSVVFGILDFWWCVLCYVLFSVSNYMIKN